MSTGNRQSIVQYSSLGKSTAQYGSPGKPWWRFASTPRLAVIRIQLIHGPFLAAFDAGMWDVEWCILDGAKSWIFPQ